MVLGSGGSVQMCGEDEADVLDLERWRVLKSGDFANKNSLRIDTDISSTYPMGDYRGQGSMR